MSIHSNTSTPNIVSPPWKLHGEGYIFIYNLSPDDQKRFWNNPVQVSGITVMMLVHYDHSPIGAYDELLLIPGQIRYTDKKGYSISHIHVSTDISTENGRKHWGIPKVTSSFVLKDQNRTHLATVNDEKGRSTKLACKPFGMKLPVFTHILPYRLLQIAEDRSCSLRPTAAGFTRLAKLEAFESDQPGFSSLVGKKPLLGFHATSFEMTFPEGHWT